MTEQKALKQLKDILDEATTDENAICYVTDYDEIPLRLAIEALEKQIPKEVSTMKYRNDYDWTCNSCDTTFKYIRYTVDKPNYCPNCGQAIKWE